MSYVYHLLQRIFSSNNYFIKSIIAVWLYFSGIHIYLYCIGALVIFDVITGIAASIKAGQKFTSEYLRKGLLEKTGLYLILLFTAFTFEIVLKSMYNFDKFFLTFFITVLITSYETVSICENVLKINPKFTFLNSIIRLSKRISKSSVESAEKKVDIIMGEEKIKKD